MTRVKGGTVARARRKKVLKQAKGYFGSKHRLYKTAHEQVMHSGVYSFRDRKQNKRNFRKLWITRINAGCRENEISYSRFIDGLNKAGVTVNRKMLSELAIDNPKAFSDLVAIAKDALNGKKYTPKEENIDEGENTLSSYEMERIAREIEFDRRIALLKQEIGYENKQVGYIADELDPNVHNLPHESVSSLINVEIDEVAR